GHLRSFWSADIEDDARRLVSDPYFSTNIAERFLEASALSIMEGIDSGSRENATQKAKQLFEETIATAKAQLWTGGAAYFNRNGVMMLNGKFDEFYAAVSECYIVIKATSEAK
ncbi:MAG: hypothetical protein AABX60_01175, partial [Nanoarchaeota archaeon]